MHTESLSKWLRKSSFPVSCSDKGSWEGSETELGLGEKPLAVVGPGLQLSAQTCQLLFWALWRCQERISWEGPPDHGASLGRDAGNGWANELSRATPELSQAKPSPRRAPVATTKACVYDNRDGGLAAGC